MELLKILKDINEFASNNKHFLSGSLSLLLTFSVLWGFVSPYVLHIVSVTYLFAKTMVETESPERELANIERLLKWWTSYSFFMIIEFAGNIILYFSPFYSIFTIMKLFFFVWLLNQEHIESFYNIVVRPIYNVNKLHIESGLLHSEEFIDKALASFNVYFDIAKEYFFNELAKYTKEAMDQNIDIDKKLD